MTEGARYYVFPDGDEWIIFAPASHLVMRANREAADKYNGMPDRGTNLSLGRAAPEPESPFPPCNVTVVCTNMCGQKCMYCYGTPAHTNGSTLDARFCREGLRLVGEQCAKLGRELQAFFHGVGEPTFIWPLFQECVGLVRETGTRYGVKTRVRLCTGGQADEVQADWLAANIDALDLSFDGPRDIQNLQRPRRDGRDSYDRPVHLARVFRQSGRPLTIKTTVTNRNVGRMGEMVELIAREIGPARLQLGFMFRPPWVQEPEPSCEEYVAEFGKAMDLGAPLGVTVEHPEVSRESLSQDLRGVSLTHFCLAPPNIVTSFYDVPEEKSGDPRLGAYGWFDDASGTIRFDHAKRRRLARDVQTRPECVACPCGANCLGVAGVKGRMPKETPVLGAHCQARIGALREIIRRIAPREPAAREAGR